GSAQFADTASVTLEAKYGHGSAFAGWTGDCDPDAPLCDITIDGDVSATARFVPGLHRRRVSLSLRKRLATGRVRVADGFAKCRNGVPVRLERRVGHRWVRSSDGRTKSTGRYALRVRGHGAYRVSLKLRKVPYGHVCKAARSPVRRR